MSTPQARGSQKYPNITLSMSLGYSARSRGGLRFGRYSTRQANRLSLRVVRRISPFRALGRISRLSRRPRRISRRR